MIKNSITPLTSLKIVTDGINKLNYKMLYKY